MRSDVDANFGHHTYGHGVDRAGGVESRTDHGGGGAQRGAKDALGEVTAAAVASAEDEDGRGFHMAVKIILSPFVTQPSTQKCAPMPCQVLGVGVGVDRT